MLDYTGTLEPIVSKSATGTASYRPTLYALLNAAKNRPNTHPYDGATPEQWYAFDTKTHKTRAQHDRAAVPARRVEEAAAGRPQDEGQERRAAARRPPARSGPTTRSRPAPPATHGTQHRFVMFRMPNDKNMVVFGRDVRDAKSDYDPQSGPDVTMGFSSTGHEGVQEHHERARASAGA